MVVSGKGKRGGALARIPVAPSYRANEELCEYWRSTIPQARVLSQGEVVWIRGGNPLPPKHKPWFKANWFELEVRSELSWDSVGRLFWYGGARSATVQFWCHVSFYLGSFSLSDACPNQKTQMLGFTRRLSMLAFSESFFLHFGPSSSFIFYWLFFRGSRSSFFPPTHFPFLSSFHLPRVSLCSFILNLWSNLFNFS